MSKRNKQTSVHRGPFPRTFEPTNCTIQSGRSVVKTGGKGKGIRIRIRQA